MRTKKILFGSVVLLATSLGFVGCSDDDDNEPKDDNEPTVDKPAEDVAGSYTGTISMVFAYGSLKYEDKTVTLTANGDNAVDISMDDEDLGVADMKDVSVERNDDGSVSIVETEGVLSMPNQRLSQLAITLRGKEDRTQRPGSGSSNSLCVARGHRAQQAQQHGGITKDI